MGDKLPRCMFNNFCSPCWCHTWYITWCNTWRHDTPETLMERWLQLKFRDVMEWGLVWNYEEIPIIMLRLLWSSNLLCSLWSYWYNHPFFIKVLLINSTSLWKTFIFHEDNFACWLMGRLSGMRWKKNRVNRPGTSQEVQLATQPFSKAMIKRANHRQDSPQRHGT